MGKKKKRTRIRKVRYITWIQSEMDWIILVGLQRMVLIFEISMDLFSFVFRTQCIESISLSQSPNGTNHSGCCQKPLVNGFHMRLTRHSIFHVKPLIFPTFFFLYLFVLIFFYSVLDFNIFLLLTDHKMYISYT